MLAQLSYRLAGYGHALCMLDGIFLEHSGSARRPCVAEASPEVLGALRMMQAVRFPAETRLFLSVWTLIEPILPLPDLYPPRKVAKATRVPIAALLKAGGMARKVAANCFRGAATIYTH